MEFFVLTEVSLKAESLEQAAEETECGLASPSDIVEAESALSVMEGELGMMVWLTVCHEEVFLGFLGLEWPVWTSFWQRFWLLCFLADISLRQKVAWLNLLLLECPTSRLTPEFAFEFLFCPIGYLVPLLLILTLPLVAVCRDLFSRFAFCWLAFLSYSNS